MAWWELHLEGLPRTRLEEASARLFAIGAAGLEERYLPGEAPPPRQPWDRGPTAPEPERIVLVAWFEDPDPVALGRRLVGFAPATRWVEVEEQDWSESWKQGFETVRISDRLVISPPWDAPPGALIVEPGQGFGTGHHPTTRQALAALDRRADGLRTCLDVGCGSGILALAAARLGLEVEGVDVEASAIRDAERNAVVNDLQARFSTTPVSRLRGPYDLVLANLHAELVELLGSELIRLTGSWLVIAGILADREPIARAALEPALELVAREVDGEWVSLEYRRRR